MELFAEPDELGRTESYKESVVMWPVHSAICLFRPVSQQTADLRPLKDRLDKDCSAHGGVHGDTEFIWLSTVDMVEPVTLAQLEQTASAMTDWSKRTFRGTLTSDHAATLPSDKPVSHRMHVAFDVPTQDLPLLDSWYLDEHIDLILETADWRRVRRYTGLPGSAWNRLAVHDLTSANVMTDPIILDSMKTPFRAQMAAHPWFSGDGRAALPPL